MTITRHRQHIQVHAVGLDGMRRLPDHVIEVLIVHHDDGTAGWLAPFPLPRRP